MQHKTAEGEGERGMFVDLDDLTQIQIIRTCRHNLSQNAQMILGQLTQYSASVPVPKSSKDLGTLDTYIFHQRPIYSKTIGVSIPSNEWSWAVWVIYPAHVLLSEYIAPKVEEGYTTFKSILRTETQK